MGTLNFYYMPFTYSNLTDNLSSTLRNQLGSVEQTRVRINTSLRDLIHEIDLKSLTRKTKTFRALHDDVFRYPVPSDMRDEAIIDIRKYKYFDEGSSVNYEKKTRKKFYQLFDKDTFTFEYDEGLTWLLGNFTTDSASTVIHNMNSLTDNGTWSADDDGTNITANTSNYISGTASIDVDMQAAGTTLSIVNSTINTVDLSNSKKFFYFVYLPSAADLSLISSFNLIYGSTSVAIATATATAPFNTDTLVQGWNLIGFEPGTESGSPDLTAVDYVKNTINFSSTPSTLTGFLFENVIATIGQPYEITYYSAYPWKNTSGTWIEDSTSNQDILNMKAEEFGLAIKKLNYDLAQAIPMSDTEVERFFRDYLQEKARYGRRYPSEAKKTKLRY